MSKKRYDVYANDIVIVDNRQSGTQQYNRQQVANIFEDVQILAQYFISVRVDLSVSESLNKIFSFFLFSQIITGLDIEE